MSKEVKFCKKSW